MAQAAAPAPAVQKKAIITGITGQDGSYLAELLLEKGYEVHGIIRRSSYFNTKRIDHVYHKLKLHYGDVTDGSALQMLISTVKPDEIFNLAAQSHVAVSFECPEYTAHATGVSVLKILDAIRSAGIEKTCRFYQASTSELYGGYGKACNETDLMHPRSPYGVAKLYGYWITINYRESYNMFAVNGILFNHESPRRGATFVTQKIVRAAVRIKAQKQDVLALGNIDALRDWGHAKDYVRGMWMMLQQDKPEDYVLAMGEQHSVREFCELTFSKLGMPITWSGKGVDEVGKSGDRVLIKIDPRYFRPAEVESLLGDATKAKTKLGWTPQISFMGLVDDMIQYETKALETGEDDWA